MTFSTIRDAAANIAVLCSSFYLQRTFPENSVDWKVTMVCMASGLISRCSVLCWMSFFHHFNRAPLPVLVSLISGYIYCLVTANQNPRSQTRITWVKNASCAIDPFHCFDVAGYTYITMLVFSDDKAISPPKNHWLKYKDIHDQDARLKTRDLYIDARVGASYTIPELNTSKSKPPSSTALIRFPRSFEALINQLDPLECRRHTFPITSSLHYFSVYVTSRYVGHKKTKERCVNVIVSRRPDRVILSALRFAHR
jgi:hypothetical protein